jgi:peptidyl-prolyl cis-trans isomerase C
VNQITPLLSFAGIVFGAFTAAAQTAPPTKAHPARKPPVSAPAPAPAAAPKVAVPSPANAEPTDPNKVVLVVGDQKLTAAQFEEMLQAFPPQTQAAARGPQRRDFAEQFVQLKVIAQEAERRKLDQQPKVQQQLALQRENILAGLLFQELMSSTPVDEAAERRYYDAHKNEFGEAKAHHILIRFKGSPVPLGAGKKDLTEAEALAKAEAIRKDILAGKDFGAEAKAESDDTGSATNGGDLGSFNPTTMVKEFADAAFALPVGQLSEPVKTQFGYHLIRVDSRDAKTFDQVKAEIDKKMRPDAVKAQMDALRAKSNVMIDDSFFGPAKPVAEPVTK